MSETVVNVAAMVARVRKAMPDDLVRSVSPKFVAEQCQIAWDNGWRDPAWLVKGGLAGTQMPNVVNGAAMFTAQFRDACAEPCPLDETPTPPRSLPPRSTSVATDAQRAYWLDHIRAGFAARKAGLPDPTQPAPSPDDPWRTP